VIGLEDSAGMLLAFGSFGRFRAWPAYKYTVEHSVYVHQDHRGKGLGKRVMQALIAAARENDVHAMVGGIDASNTASVVLHEHLGFQHVGTLPQVGFKFGRWLDLAFYQLLLDTPNKADRWLKSDILSPVRFHTGPLKILKTTRSIQPLPVSCRHLYRYIFELPKYHGGQQEMLIP
jgi:hypothetical protein